MNWYDYPTFVVVKTPISCGGPDRESHVVVQTGDIACGDNGYTRELFVKSFGPRIELDGSLIVSPIPGKVVGEPHQNADIKSAGTAKRHINSVGVDTLADRIP